MFHQLEKGMQIKIRLTAAVTTISIVRCCVCVDLLLLVGLLFNIQYSAVVAATNCVCTSLFGNTQQTM